MANWRTLELCAVGVIALTLVSSGLAGGVAGVTPPALDDGSATASVETLQVERMQIDDGRFGTDVRYLRVPDAKVRVSDVDGTPRLNYRVAIPALDVKQTSTKLLTDPERRTVRIAGEDRTLDPDRTLEDEYTATVTVSVQSFTADESIYTRTTTVEVQP